MTEGSKTSEGIGTAIMAVLAGGYGLDTEDPTVKAAALLAMGLAVGLYSLGRGIRKGGKSDA